MQVGISLTSLHAVDDPREGARRMVERARAAEAAGLDSLFVGDHHATPAPYYQNTPILGRLLAEWGERAAGALYLLPLWHPVLVAEQVGTLAAIARGRFVLQCAIGPDDPQFPAFGVDVRHRPSRFEESLSILRRLWAGETVTHEGRWKLDGARIAPVPAEPVEVWIGAVARPAIERAARLGDGWLAAPAMPIAAARAPLALYREQCEANGRACGTTAIRRDVHVGESAEAAAAEARPFVERGYRGFPPEALAIGDPETVAAGFRELAEQGYEHVIVRSLVADQAAAVASIERLGRVRELVADA